MSNRKNTTKRVVKAGPARATAEKKERVSHDLPLELSEEVALLIQKSKEYRALADSNDATTMGLIKGWMIGTGLKAEEEGMVSISADGKKITI